MTWDISVFSVIETVSLSKKMMEDYKLEWMNLNPISSAIDSDIPNLFSNCSNVFGASNIGNCHIPFNNVFSVIETVSLSKKMMEDYKLEWMNLNRRDEYTLPDTVSITLNTLISQVI
jgi:hypothetical protein